MLCTTYKSAKISATQLCSTSVCTKKKKKKCFKVIQSAVSKFLAAVGK